jgi:hypothetical protein
MKKDLVARSIGHLTEPAEMAVQATEMALDRAIILTSFTCDVQEENVHMEYRFQDDGSLHAVVDAKTVEFKEVPSPGEQLERLKAALVDALVGAAQDAELESGQLH